MGVTETETSDVSEVETLKQTSFKQTSQEQDVHPLWKPILADFRLQMSKSSYDTFMADTDLIEIQEDVAVIAILYNYAKDWLEARLSAKIARALGVNSIRCVVLTE